MNFTSESQAKVGLSEAKFMERRATRPLALRQPAYAKTLRRGRRGRASAPIRAGSPESAVGG